MEYWRALLAVVLIIVLAIVINNVREKRSWQKRDLAYQEALRSYSQDFKPGMSRKEVEDLLHIRNKAFRQMCCVDIKKSMDVWDDLVKIAQEDAPWFCSEKNVYIAFQFAGKEPHATRPSAELSDRLTAVTVYPWLEGCL